MLIDLEKRKLALEDLKEQLVNKVDLNKSQQNLEASQHSPGGVNATSSLINPLMSKENIENKINELIY